MKIQLHGRLVTCTPEEYKRLIDLNLIELPTYQTDGIVQNLKKGVDNENL